MYVKLFTARKINDYDYFKFEYFNADNGFILFHHHGIS